jgi:hypothetical protein
MAAQEDADEMAAILTSGFLKGARAEKVAVTKLVTTSVTVRVFSLADAVSATPLTVTVLYTVWTETRVVVSMVWDKAPTAVGVVEATATTIETEASEGMPEEMTTAEAFDGDRLTCDDDEEEEVAELASVPSTKLAATSTVDVAKTMWSAKIVEFVVPVMVVFEIVSLTERLWRWWRWAWRRCLCTGPAMARQTVLSVLKTRVTRIVKSVEVSSVLKESDGPASV